jgi:hypothetical protein
MSLSDKSKQQSFQGLTRMVKKQVPITELGAPIEAAASSKHAPQNIMTAAEKALKTATWARTMTKVIISRNNKKPPFWHVINFLGAGKQESGGIIDLLAIRKDHSKISGLPKGDGFEIILVQVKGGGARSPTLADVQRMEAVKQRYGAKAVVLSSWKKGAAAEFRVLTNSVWGDTVDPDSIFGGLVAKPTGVATGQQKISTKAVKSAVVGKKRSDAAKAAWETRRKVATK